MWVQNSAGATADDDDDHLAFGSKQFFIYAGICVALVMFSGMSK